MARNTAKVPDAWEDDDWESQADRAAVEGPSHEPEPPAPRLSKAERLAQHAELNRKLWESAYVLIPPATLRIACPFPTRSLLRHLLYTSMEKLTHQPT